MNKKSLIASVSWIFFVSRRFSAVDRTGRAAVTNFLASLGICLGVMTLLTVVSVMNGFQMSFINAIMEISSGHIQVAALPAEQEAALRQFCRGKKNIQAVAPFYESQALIAGAKGREESALIRGVSPSILAEDAGFAHELRIVDGAFALSGENAIVLGIALAHKLGVKVGDTVNLLALGGGADTALVSDARRCRVSGLFECGYMDINSSFAFIGLDTAKNYFGAGSPLIYGIKLRRPHADAAVAAELERAFPDASVQSWREFNRSFFGTLRIEKNILMLLVLLIFIVVGINIYNGMRRLVFERSREISILSALGGSAEEIQAIFIMRGFTSGFIGSLTGAAAGLLISANMAGVFTLIARIMFFAEYIPALFSAPENVAFIYENPMYRVFASIPARFYFSETLMITLFGIAAPLLASWQASRNALQMNAAEVLHDE